MSVFRAPLLVALALLPVESVRAAAPPRAAFSEVAEQVGLEFEHSNGATGQYYFPEVNGSGAGFLDFDNDGDLDVFLVQGAPLDGEEDADSTGSAQPLDRLFRNDIAALEGGGSQVTFVDVTVAAGVEADGFGMGVATGDYDNDGWTDLYVTRVGGNQMWRNNGDGTFSDATAATGTDDPRWSISATFVDYDRDGWLDLYVANYVDWALASHKPCRSYTGALDYCGPLAYNPEPDRLFRNRGDGGFEVVSAASGIGSVAGSSMGVVATDVNHDGWPDLYVSNDGMENWMWVNERDGTFSNQALLGGTAFNGEGRPEAGMGVMAGDFDNDGDEDMIVSHLSRETNTLLERVSDAFFEDASLGTGVALPSWEFTGFGIAWFDYDNDGWLDLAVANGAVKRLEPLARAGDAYPFHQTNQLFRNDGAGGYLEATSDLGEAAGLSEVSRGLAVGDFDNDGDADFLVSNGNGPARLLRNEVGTAKGWLQVRMLGAPSAAGGAEIGAAGTGAYRDMLGTWAELATSDGRKLARAVRTGGSYASAHDPRLLFGVGSADADSLHAVWPSGRRSTWRLGLRDRSLTLFERVGQ